VVTAGTDAGLTVMELLPGGQLQTFATGVFETGAGMAAVTGLEAAVHGDTVTFYVTDARADRVQTINMSLAALGGQVDAQAGSAVGTGKADLIWGSAARETLQGGGGDDFIFSGGGADVMTGGSGADVFVLAEASDNIRITDFELHSDRIDLSAWGRIYATSALTINPTSNGALVQFNGHSLTLVSGHSMTAASFFDSDFSF
jgi:Ca2+-binding RTX toxin-like protein